MNHLFNMMFLVALGCASPAIAQDDEEGEFKQLESQNEGTNQQATPAQSANEPASNAANSNGGNNANVEPMSNDIGAQELNQVNGNNASALDEPGNNSQFTNGPGSNANNGNGPLFENQGTPIENVPTNINNGSGQVDASGEPTTPASDVPGANVSAPSAAANGSIDLLGGASGASVEMPTTTDEADLSAGDAYRTAPDLPPPNEFSGAPPIPGSLRVMASGEAPEEYKVERGDTLFDICDQLLDEPNYWPKLWSLNPEIKNPHFIFPGMLLRFYPGNESTPPYMTVVTEEDVVPVEKPGLTESELLTEEVMPTQEQLSAAPPTEVVSAEELQLPSDLVDFLEVSGKTYDGTAVSLMIPGFIYEDKVDQLGVVIGGVDGQAMKGDRERMILEADRGLSAGSTYTVLRYGGKVSNPTEGGFVGYRYDYVATVKVSRALADEKFVAEISMSRLGAKTGDIVAPYVSVMRTIDLAASPSASTTDAEVVGFDYPDQLFGGKGNYVFVGKGAGGGMSTGQDYAIYQRFGLWAPKSDKSQYPDEDSEQVGVLRIIDSTSAGAVGYIITSKREIRVGDNLGKGG